MTGLIEYSEMEKFSIGELRRIGMKWYNEKEHEISMHSDRESSFLESTLGVLLRTTEDEYIRQVS